MLSVKTTSHMNVKQRVSSGIGSSKLKKTTIGKSAFTKINKKATISVPKKKVKAYKSAFKKAGAAKSVKVKKIK